MPVTVTLNLPPEIEQAFIGEATSRGLTPDELVSEVVLARISRHPSLSDREYARLEIEEGIPVLHTGHPLPLSAIDETLELVRRERDLDIYGNF